MFSPENSPAFGLLEAYQLEAYKTFRADTRDHRLIFQEKSSSALSLLFRSDSNFYATRALIVAQQYLVVLGDLADFTFHFAKEDGLENVFAKQVPPFEYWASKVYSSPVGTGLCLFNYDEGRKNALKLVADLLPPADKDSKRRNQRIRDSLEKKVFKPWGDLGGQQVAEARTVLMDWADGSPFDASCFSELRLARFSFPFMWTCWAVAKMFWLYRETQCPST